MLVCPWAVGSSAMVVICPEAVITSNAKDLFSARTQADSSSIYSCYWQSARMMLFTLVLRRKGVSSTVDASAMLHYKYAFTGLQRPFRSTPFYERIFNELQLHFEALMCMVVTYFQQSQIYHFCLLTPFLRSGSARFLHRRPAA